MPGRPRCRHALVLEAVYLVVLAHLAAKKLGLFGAKPTNLPRSNTLVSRPTYSVESFDFHTHPVLATRSSRGASTARVRPVNGFGLASRASPACLPRLRVGLEIPCLPRPSQPRPRPVRGPMPRFPRPARCVLVLHPPKPPLAERASRAAPRDRTRGLRGGRDPCSRGWSKIQSCRLRLASHLRARALTP